MALRMPDNLGAVAPTRDPGIRISPLDVSSGLEDIGRALDKVADRERAERERIQAEDDATALSMSVTTFRSRQTERLMNEGDELADDAVDGFSDRYAVGMDEAMQAALQALPTRVRPQAQREFFETRETLRLRALTVETGRRSARRVGQLNQQMLEAGNIVFHDATQYAEVLERSEQAIRESGISQADQATALELLPGQLADRRMLGLIDDNPHQALRELDQGTWDQQLTTEKINQHMDAARREIERRRAEAERQRAAARERLGAGLRQRMDDDLASRLQTGRPVPVLLEEVALVFGARAADAYEAERNQASDNHEIIRRFQFETPAQIEAQLRDLRPRGGEEGFEGRQRRYQAVAEIAADVLEARREDPAAAALAADPVLAQSWGYMAREEATQADRTLAFRMMRDRQTRLGIPAGQQRLTTNDQAAGIAARIQGAPPAERARAIEAELDTVQGLYGSDSSRVLAEVARINEMPELGALAAVSDPQGRRRVARALGQPEAEVSQGTARIITSEVERALAPLSRSLRGTPGAEERLSAARDAAVRTARAEAFAGAPPRDAAQSAAGLFTREYQFQSGVRMPRTWNGRRLDAGRMLRGADAALDQIAESGEARFPAGDARASAGDQRRMSADAVRASARWMTLPNDRGLMLVDEYGDAIKDAQGEPIRRGWDELGAAADAGNDDWGARQARARGWEVRE